MFFTQQKECRLCPFINIFSLSDLFEITLGALLLSVRLLSLSVYNSNPKKEVA